MKYRLSILSLLFASFSFAQTDSSKYFKIISRSINAFYNEAGKQAPGYKQFKRWEWYYSTRSGENGALVNNISLNMEALNSSSRSQIMMNPNANTGSWTHIGPTSVASNNKGIGRVNRIAFHPTDVNTMYAAAATGGLWITTDGGANWYSYSEGIPNMSLNGVVVDYTNPSVIYILTGDADGANGGARGQFMYGKTSIGVLKSYDGGFTWHRTGLSWSETDNIRAYKLMIHPTNPSVLMVATTQGIYRSTNGAASWDSTETSRAFYDMEFQPGNPSVVYASGTYLDSIIVMKSTNIGQNFIKTHGIHREDNYEGNSVSNRSALGVSVANSNYVYLLAGPCTAAGTFQGFYRSTNAGESFSLRTSSPNILGASYLGADAKDQHGYDLCIAANPTNIDRVACGGIKLWTSINGGSSFSWQDDYVNSFSYYHADIHDMVYHPLDNSKLYMCGDGGVYISFNSGGDWAALNNGLSVTQYYKIGTNIGIGLGSENIIIGGTQDNGTNKRGSGGGSTFSQVLGADGMDCLIDPDGLNSYISSTQDGEIYYSGNAGSSYSKIGDPESVGNFLNTTVTGRWLTPVAEITGSTTQYVIGYEPAVIATNIGSGWIFTNIGWSGLSFVKTARGNANRIYIGDNDRLNSNIIKTTTNQGSSWTTVLDESNSTPVTDLTFDPTNGNRIWITYGGYTAGKKVRFSNDGGANWTYVNGTLPNVPINCIVYDNSSGAAPDALYLGTDIGVFYKDNNLGDWIPFSNGLPVVEITDLEVHPTEGLLRAGTYGRGMWETSLYSSCPANITLTTSNTAIFKPYYFQASQTIGSTAQHYGAGANVFYKAGTEITLTPGFMSGANTFEAAIGPCGGGVPSRVQQKTVKPLKGFLVD